MKITSWEVVVVRPPIRHKGNLGVGRLEAVENVLVILHTDEDLTGIGEASPWPVFAETPHATKDAIERYLGPAIQNENPFDLERLLGKMSRVLAGFPFAKAAIEMALLDIVGKALGQPIYTLLGGLFRDRITVGYSIANQNIKEDVEEIEWLLSQGLRAFKIKTGVLPLREEIDRLRAIQDCLSSDSDLRIDFNQGLAWETAFLTCREIERFQPTFIEQPLKKWNIEGMARLARKLDTPIMADESVFSVHDAMRVVRAGAADIVSIKIMKPGGILNSKKVAAICEGAGIPCYAGAMWESSIGIAASLHFVASTPNVIYGSDFYIPNLLMLDDLVEEPLRIENGQIMVPGGPGLGVAVDHEAIGRYRVD